MGGAWFDHRGAGMAAPLIISHSATTSLGQSVRVRRGGSIGFAQHSRLSRRRKVRIPHDPSDAPRSVWLFPPDGEDLAYIRQRRLRARWHHGHLVGPAGMDEIAVARDLNDTLLKGRNLREPGEELLHRRPALHNRDRKSVV